MVTFHCLLKSSLSREWEMGKGNIFAFSIQSSICMKFQFQLMRFAILHFYMVSIKCESPLYDIYFKSS